MQVKYILKLRDSLKIQTDDGYLLLYYKYNRFVLMNKRIGYVDTDKRLANKKLSIDDIILQLIHLFKSDLNVLEQILANKRLKIVLVEYIKDNEPKWDMYLNDYTYNTSENFKIKIFLNKDKFNKESVKFLVSRYFDYFEKAYLIEKKAYYIDKISYIHNTEKQLIPVLCSVSKDFKFKVIDVSNIELVKFLKAYSNKLYS